MKIDLDDITIVPAVSSLIESRNQCNIFDSNCKIPLIVSPMDTVIDEYNFGIFKNVYYCVPRNENFPYDINGIKAYGLNEIETIINDITAGIFGEYDLNYQTLKERMENHNIADEIISSFFDHIKYENILIDIANGHMFKLVNIIKTIKLMSHHYCKVYIGNVANPETYKILAEAGANGVRLNIGSGQACLTAVNTAIFYPIASLIQECKIIKDKYNFDTKIIADGGCKNYSDIIKCLALGADLIMIGSLFNKCIESAGQKYVKIFNKYIPINQKLAERLFQKKWKIYVKYRGMSTKEVQKKWKKNRIVTSEGATRIRKVEYTYKGFIENFSDYLKSAMSYTGCNSITDFIGKVQVINITENSYKRFNK